MNQEQVPRVPSVWVQLSAKWAGSGKISGCGDRNYYCPTLSDDNKDNSRAASKYLKVLLRSINYNRSNIYYHKWNYWKFEFSPHKNNKNRQHSSEEIGKDLCKERWDLSLIDTGIAQDGGTHSVKDKGNFNI